MIAITDRPLAEAMAGAPADGPRWLLPPERAGGIGCVELERVLLIVPQFLPVTLQGETCRDAFAIYGPGKYAHLYGPELAAAVAARAVALRTAPDAPARFVLGSADNHFHWLADFLPRLDLLRRRPELAEGGVLVDAGFRSGQQVILDWVTECLALARIRPRPVPQGLVGVRRAALPTRVSRAEAVRFWRRLAPAAPRPWRRLFVCRGGVARRRLVDEAAVAAALARAGFEALDPGTMSFAEQMRAFGEASVIVGTHGAALANILFAGPGTRIVELRSASHTSEFRDLAAAGAQPYAAVPLVELTESHSEPLHRD
uniref:glycosyltransferase family 61 protein n=1 Tax=Stella sp. TaxID=2912054 RepID=UPI0035AEB792